MATTASSTAPWSPAAGAWRRSADADSRTWLAHLVGADAVTSFRVLNLAACAALTLVAALLVLGAAAPGRRRAAVLPALAVGSVCLASRDLLHSVVNYPAVTDPVALLCLLVGALALAHLGPRAPSSAPAWAWTVLLVVVAGVAPLARETFGVPLAAGAVAAAALRVAPWRTTLATVVAAVAGTAAAFAAATPAADGSDSVLRVTAGWVVSDVGSASGLVRFSVMLAIAVLFPALPLLSRRLRDLVDPREWVLVAAAAALFAVSVFGGGDTDRILTPVGVVLVVALGRVAVRHPETLLPLGLVVLAQVVAQAPWTVVGSSAQEWGSYFDLRLTAPREVLVHGVLPVALAPAAPGRRCPGLARDACRGCYRGGSTRRRN